MSELQPSAATPQPIGRSAVGRWLGLAGGVALVAIGAVVYQAQQAAADNEGWAAVAAAREQGSSPPSWEGARETARGTSAEPWANYHLALALIGQGDADGRRRSRELAEQVLEGHADHPVASFLRELIAAVDSYGDPAGS